jgi:hypothetical protein
MTWLIYYYVDIIIDDWNYYDRYDDSIDRWLLMCWYLVVLLIDYIDRCDDDMMMMTVLCGSNDEGLLWV